MSRGTGMSSGGEVGGRRGPDGGQLHLPPGFRFYPSDEELVVHYLCKKAASQPFAVPIIAEVDLYKFDPWDLPAKALFGEKEWYFFSPRDRKYPNGSRPNRAAGSGYWKATGTDKPIYHVHHNGSAGQKVGVKKALVFYTGRPPKGEKTNWIMHEYRLADSATKAAKRKGSLRLDDWVLCRIYKKLPSATRLAMQKEEATPSEEVNEFEEVLEGLPDMEEDSKLAMARTMSSMTTPMMSFGTNYNTTHMSNHTNYNDNLSGSYYQPYVTMDSQLAQQVGPASLAEHVNRPFLKPGLMNDEGMHYKPYGTLKGTNNYTTSVPGRPLITIPNFTPEHSPVNSSVDEERGLPVEQGLPENRAGNVLVGNGYAGNAHSTAAAAAVSSCADPVVPPFNFDALPSPFGRLESLHQFPFLNSPKEHY